ncbi:MAG TPA: hypothetical protein VIK16_02675 [Candidatus Limnocylindrales bacterium]
MAEPIPPIVLRMRTAADPATLWATLSVPERVATWFTTARHAGWADTGLGETGRDDHRGAWQEGLDGLLDLLSGGA